MAAPQSNYDLRTPAATPFDDEILKDALVNIRDTISAAWNGWEHACQFQDHDKMAYYMNLIKNFCEVEMKLNKLKKN